MAQVAFVWLECTPVSPVAAPVAGRKRERERESQGGWDLYVCVLHRSTSSTRPLTHPRQKARGSSVRICTYMAAFNKNTRRSRQSVRRCSANILFISADGFSVLARVVVPFFFFFPFLFFEKSKRRIPLARSRELRYELQRIPPRP